ncbi:MAG: 30S ribosomal protein S6 [Kiritimatiellae bacterium]|nr:30S ribosomal protein S6 [Kiritimatiellia bacterium]
MNRKYDALYIFVGTAKDDALNANLEKALAEVARLGGTILSTESLGKRTFSRPMKKRESGVYVKVRFEMDPSKVAELVNRYKLVEEVFRVQILAADERREAILADERARRQAEAEASAARAAESTASRVAEGSDEAVQSGTVEEA